MKQTSCHETLASATSCNPCARDVAESGQPKSFSSGEICITCATPAPRRYINTPPSTYPLNDRMYVTPLHALNVATRSECNTLDARDNAAREGLIPPHVVGRGAKCRSNCRSTARTEITDDVERSASFLVHAPLVSLVNH